MREIRVMAWNQLLTFIKGHNSVNDDKDLLINNAIQDLPNIHVHIKFQRNPRSRTSYHMKMKY